MVGIAPQLRLAGLETTNKKKITRKAKMMKTEKIKEMRKELEINFLALQEIQDHKQLRRIKDVK